MKTLSEQIQCVKREIAMRLSVYRRRVSDGKMTQAQADHEIECMKAVLDTLASAFHGKESWEKQKDLFNDKNV